MASKATSKATSMATSMATQVQRMVGYYLNVSTVPRQSRLRRVLQTIQRSAFCFHKPACPNRCRRLDDPNQPKVTHAKRTPVKRCRDLPQRLAGHAGGRRGPALPEAHLWARIAARIGVLLDRFGRVAVPFADPVCPIRSFLTRYGRGCPDKQPIVAKH